MLAYIIKCIMEAQEKNHEWLELKFSNQFEKDFEEITGYLKDYKYKKFRLEEVYRNDFLVRFDLRELS